ncbi:AAA family ATPase [Nostoc sp. CENA67]|uniref:Nuclease SbcCD subunit C n=1 Tax=Amazonocrinis nigriterrae CENA67 TaxID=2794033 RepID=A0A8J7HXZ5_9NOST|nr:AAA family ATPase [Amazonocrinis nigriterrae]MBH8564429.1 AAA family ATPase [Amazonocrinis nigriterrae CENA67]
MKLLSIQLCNFRPFYGRTPELILASREEQNTTVFYGNNGGGKTTILNAFTWVLYEKFTPAFASSEQLVNKRAVAEVNIGQSVDFWVQVEFEHTGKKYLAKRICRAFKSKDGVYYDKSNLSLQVAEKNGRWMTPFQPSKEVINRVLPESLHTYFFFDGERIEKIVQSDKKFEMAAATKVLLGVEILDRAIRHLNEAKRELEKEYQDIAPPEITKLIQDKKALEDECITLQERQLEIKYELENQQIIEQKIDEQLRALEDVQQLQMQRDELQIEADSTQTKINQGKNKLRKITSTKAYTVFLSEATAEFRAILDGLRERGELPAGIKQQFVKDLLQQQRCICGTELKHATQPYSLVEAWMNRAGRGDVEETAIRMGAQVESIDKQITEFWKEIDDEQKNQEELIRKLSVIETQLDDIHDELRNSPLENIRDLETHRQNIKKRTRELTLEEGENNKNIADLQVKIKHKENLYIQQKANQKKQKVALERINLTNESISRLTQVRELIDKHFRLELENSVQTIFQQIAFKPYVPKLNDKYELTLVENTSGKEDIVAASSGESIILSLSFIASIINKVREWSKKQNLIDLGSSIFPVVMDSPFAVLDNEYKSQIAKRLPRLADQLVLLLNKSQWMNVEQEISNYVGKHYILTYHSPKANCQEEYIHINGQSYPLVQRSLNELEYTEILEVV